MRSLWLTGRAGVTVAEAARAMVEEARQMLQKDLGIHIDWASSQERENSLVAAASINSKRSIIVTWFNFCQWGLERFFREQEFKEIWRSRKGTKTEQQKWLRREVQNE